MPSIVANDGPDAGSLWGWFNDSLTKIGNAARDSFLCKQYGMGCGWGDGAGRPGQARGYGGDWVDEDIPTARGYGDGPRYERAGTRPSGWSLGGMSDTQLMLVGVALGAVVFLVSRR